MKPASRSAHREDSDREALRRRVKLFYLRFNEEAWEECFSFIDPKLIDQGKVAPDTYSARMQAFKSVYGTVKPWMTRLSMHLDVSTNPRDKRPFAYVYLIWQDDAHGFHMFRERWIKDNGRWFTRVVGLVPNRQETGAERDG